MIFIVIVPFILLPFIEKMSFKNCLYLLSSLSLSFLWTYKQTALVKVTSDFHATKIQWSHQRVPLLGISPKGVEAGTWRDMCTMWSIIHQGQKVKQLQGSLIGEWINKMYIQIMEYYSALGRKEILTHAATWLNLEDMLIKWSKSDTDGQVWYDSSYMRYLNSEIHKDRK